MWIELVKDVLGQKAGQRIDVDDRDAEALVQSGAARKLDEGPTERIVTRALGEAMGQLNDRLTASVESALRSYAEAETKSRRSRRPLLFGPAGDGDPDGPTFGRFLLAVRANDLKALEAMGSHFVAWGVEQKAAMSSQGGTTGGYSVPIEFVDQVLMYEAERSVCAGRAYRHPMASQTVEIPYLDQVTAPSAGDTAFFGGVKAYWGEEASTISETEPALRQLRLTAHELRGFSYLSNTLLQDNAVGLEALLLRLFGAAVAWYTDYACLRGSGVGQPLGALTWAGAISVNRGTANQFKLDDAAQMLSRLAPGWSPESTCWVVHPYVQRYLWQFADTAGNAVYIDSARAKPATMLFGIPVEVSEKVPALGTAKDVSLIDWSKYVLGERRMIEVAHSDHYRFLNNQGTWRFVARLDGQPWMRDKITLADGSSTLSPVVYLN